MASFRKLSLLLALFLTVIIILIIPVTSQPQPQPQACESYKHGGLSGVCCFPKSDGTMAAYTSPIGSYGTTLEEGSLSFEVHGVSASFEDGTVILYASFQLHGNPKSVNHVWQEGLVSDDDSLRSHALSGANFKSFGRIDFLTGKVSDRDALTQNSKILIRKRESSLGYCDYIVLTPKACQMLAYIIGTIGFALGIFLSSPSLSSLSPYGFVHASIGIAVFVSATVQVLAAIFLRPDKHHKAESCGTSSTTSWAMESFASPSSTCLEASPFQTLPTVGRMLILASSFHWVVWLDTRSHYLVLLRKRRNKKKMNLKETSADDNIPPQEIV
ncbi:hypothetical protein K1719_044735 [Acacia pycnantha]|nr:hypothetical protein K1719_044735 [Acacia pycnantha]